MPWLGIASALIKVVVWLVMNKLDASGRKAIAHEIDSASLSWSDADIDERLREFYRDADPPPRH
jgi:hypothetical protein